MRKEYQGDAQLRLAWVAEVLAQPLVEATTCPICCTNTGWLPTGCQHNQLHQAFVCIA